MSGWIKLHRTLKEWEWYEDANATRVLIHLLITANYKPNKWKGIVVNCGQLITSYDSLGKQLKLSRQQVRTALKKCEDSGEITRERTRDSLLVTLVKWEQMQEEQPDDNSKPNLSVTREQPDDNLRITLLKESKEREESKKVKKEENRGERSSRFVPPTFQEVVEYCNQRKNNVDAQNFIDFYQSKNWMIGKNKMKDWKASVRTWEKNRKNENNPTITQRNHTASTMFRNEQEDYSELNRRQTQNKS